MTAIWNNDGSGWKPLAPTGFPDESALHTLVEQAPHLLRQTGSPVLAGIGREVALGTGKAGLLAIEPGGRPVVIAGHIHRCLEERFAPQE